MEAGVKGVDSVQSIPQTYHQSRLNFGTIGTFVLMNAKDFTLFHFLSMFNHAGNYGSNYTFGSKVFTLK